MIGTVIALGLVNWLVTLILVDSFLTEGYREWVRRLYQRAMAAGSGRLVLAVLRKWAYLVGCQLCSGVWVGWVLALLVPGPWHWLITGLVYKAIGHATLELTAAVRALGELAKARASLTNLEVARKSYTYPVRMFTDIKES